MGNTPSELERKYKSLTDIFYEDDRGNTLLIMAVKEGHFDTAKFLLDKGLNINHWNEKGNTPLHYAVKNKNLGMVKFLIEKGANMNIRNNFGDTPYMIAVNRCYWDIPRFMEDYSSRILTEDTRVIEENNRALEEFKILEEQARNYTQTLPIIENKTENETKKEVFFSEYKTNNENCSICSERIENTGTRLTCDHPFHMGCIGTWMIQKRNKASCPLCRRKIKLE